jgi:hypothetical protein
MVSSIKKVPQAILNRDLERNSPQQTRAAIRQYGEMSWQRFGPFQVLRLCGSEERDSGGNAPRSMNLGGDKIDVQQQSTPHQPHNKNYSK